MSVRSETFNDAIREMRESIDDLAARMPFSRRWARRKHAEVDALVAKMDDARDAALERYWLS